MRSFCLPHANVEQLREVVPIGWAVNEDIYFCHPSASGVGEMPLFCGVGVCITTLPQALAASEGAVLVIWQQVSVSGSLVSWFGDWKTSAAARAE